MSKFDWIVFYFLSLRGDALDVFLHEDAVYGLAVDPRNDNIYASACADGRVLLWDIRAPSHQGNIYFRVIKLIEKISVW